MKVISNIFYMVTSVLLLSNQANAAPQAFYAVKSKTCDEAPLALKGDRLYFPGKSLMGVGFITGYQGQECRVVDFVGTAMSSFNTTNGALNEQLSVVSSVGRKNSCTGSEVQGYQGELIPGQSRIQMVSNASTGAIKSVTIYSTTRCKKLVFVMQ